MASATIDIRPVLDEPLYEMDNGEKYEVAPMGVFAATIASMLSGWMNAFAAPRQLGFAVTETVFEWDSEKRKAATPARRGVYSVRPLAAAVGLAERSASVQSRAEPRRRSDQPDQHGGWG